MTDRKKPENLLLSDTAQISENKTQPHSSKRNAKKELTQSAKKIIEETYREKFSLEEIAGKLYVNSSYLHRVFRSETGQTMLWYHNYIRCEKAKELLADPNLSIAYISSVTGFSTPSHFSKVFRRMTGDTPKEYRSNIQK